LISKPIVDGIEKDLAGKARLIRLNVLDRVGRKAAGQYQVGVVPALVILDGDGQVRYRRSGIPNRGEIVRQVDGLGQPGLESGP